MKSIGIVGSRRRDSLYDFINTFNSFIKIYKDGDHIVSGGCPKGGDRFAEIIADILRVDPLIHYPDETKLDPKILKLNPRVAYAKINYARNILIARDSDVLIACVAPDRKGGTEHTIKEWQKLHPGKEPIIV
jgi:hypothetical protein